MPPRARAAVKLMPIGGARVLVEEVSMTTFIRMLKDQSGASAAEYALILAIVGGAIALAAVFLGTTISNAMNKTANCINDTKTCS